MVVFINIRNVYEIRERPSRMYSWTALVTSQFLTDLPWNIVGSTLFFFCWYWTIGYDNDRAGYTYLVISVLFPFFYTSFGQATAAMSPNAEIAAILFSLLFSFVIILWVAISCFLVHLEIDWVNHIATVSCSHTHSLAGGSGCTAFLLTHISSKVYSAKVRPFLFTLKDQHLMVFSQQLVIKTSVALILSSLLSLRRQVRLVVNTCRHGCPVTAGISSIPTMRALVSSVRLTQRTCIWRRSLTFTIPTVGGMSGSALGLLSST
jgi:hypothetical protein